MGGHIELADQILLPEALQVTCCQEVERLREAIRSLRVRGAPAVGVVLGVARHRRLGRRAFEARLAEAEAIRAEYPRW